MNTGNTTIHILPPSWTWIDVALILIAVIYTIWPADLWPLSPVDDMLIDLGVVYYLVATDKV